MWDVEGGGVSIFHAYAEQVHITLWVKRGGMVAPLAVGCAVCIFRCVQYGVQYFSAARATPSSVKTMTDFLPSSLGVAGVKQ